MLLILLFGPALICGCIFLWQRAGIYRRSRQFQPETVEAARPPWQEVLRVVAKRIAKDKTAAWLHHLMLFGLLLMIVASLLRLFQTLGKLLGGPAFLAGLPGALLQVTTAGRILIFGTVTLFLFRRLGGRVRRLEKTPRHLVPLGLLWLILLSVFLQEGVAGALNPGMANRSLIHAWGSVTFTGVRVIFLNQLTQVLNVLNLVLLAALLAIFPRSKFYHMIGGLKNLRDIRSFQFGQIENSETQINRFMAEDAAKAVAAKAVAAKEVAAKSAAVSQNGEDKEYFGLKYLHDLNRAQVRQLDNCMSCGRCDDACPAWQSGKSLAPQRLIREQQQLLNSFGSPYDRQLVSNPEAAARVWECNLCHACENACPLAIVQVDRIVGMRRNLVLNDGAAPAAIKEMLRHLEKTGNPFGTRQIDSGSIYRELGIPILTKGERVDYLLWAGCHGLIDPRIQKVLQSLVRVLKKAGRTFAALGEKAICCGDPARRTGAEHLFQTSLYRNLDLFKEYQVTDILTICPHCMNTFKKEYPSFGASIRAVHYLEILPQLFREAELRMTAPERKKRIFYHDSCYLGRINGIFEEPRGILAQESRFEVIPLRQEREDSLCCGGGGGRIWIEEPLNQRPAALKMAKLYEKKVELVVTSCPYCLSIHSDTVLAKNMNIEVKDLVELIQA